jgi:methylphosphotriester-DNA--protein-cysteine methyltransferase
VSRRDIERRFARDVGITPKFYSRITRFQRALQAIQGGDVRLIDAALSAGYYDQPHFTRDFTGLSGLPPSAWLASDHEIARYFTRAHRDHPESHLSKPAAVGTR